MSKTFHKTQMKAGNMLYPLPAVMISCGSTPSEHNIITIAWTGTVCTNPPMLYISIRKSRHSYNIIKNSREFAVNLSTPKLAKATDWNGVKSGKDYSKFKESGLTPLASEHIACPIIGEAPVNIECKVKDILELGSHDMFLAEIVAVHADTELFDKESGALKLTENGLIAYAHGNYYELGNWIGKFGFSVMKEKTKKRLYKQK